MPTGDLSILLTSAGTQTDFDSVTLNEVSVPEPGSMTLLAAGLLCAGLLTKYLRS